MLWEIQSAIDCRVAPVQFHEISTAYRAGSAGRIYSNEGVAGLNWRVCRLVEKRVQAAQALKTFLLFPFSTQVVLKELWSVIQFQS